MDHSLVRSAMVSSMEFAVRVRPPLHLQEAENVGLYVDPSERVIVGNKYFFTADHALPSNPSQSRVFERFSGNVRRFLEGYDVSFVAFGRSNSGKTYSLVGPLNQNAFDVGPESGIIPRVTHHMFNYLYKARISSGLNFNVFFSFFEAPAEEVGIDGPQVHDGVNRKPTTDLPLNNTTRECTSFEEVMQCLQMVMKNYPFERSHHYENSHTNCFFRLTLHQQLMQAGKMYATSSRCTFVDLGSYESSYCFGLSNHIVQHLRVSNSGLELISRVLSIIAEESESSSQIASAPSVIIAALKDILNYSSKTILLFCVSPCSVDSSNSLNDLLIIERLRLLYGSHSSEKKNQSYDIKMMTNHDHDSGKEDAVSLEFAASQWQLLVSNAECLFQKLVQGEIPADAKGQIEQWLFLKQECEDCFKQDSPGLEKTKCSLDRIDEVTESDGRTSLENSGETGPENDDEDVDYDDELEGSHRNDLTSAQSESYKREFAQKLENYLGRFRTYTDQLVSDVCDAKSMGLKRIKESKSNEGKRHHGLQRKAASAESLWTPTKERTDVTNLKGDKQIMAQSEVSNLDRIASPDDGILHSDEMLRVEIASLRVTKDYLHEQKRELTAKMNEIKYMTNAEQRKLIEADEAIEAIDSAMEFKNEMLCGRLGPAKTELEERGERMLTDRLLNLSNHEMRILLCKYFKKVVDLREAGRKMEKVIADQDHQMETQNFRVLALTNAVHQTRVECERRMIMVLKEQEKKYQVNFHHFASESSGASSSTDNRSENHSTTTTTTTSTNTGPLFEIGGGAAAVPAADKALTTIPQQNLKKLQGSSTHTTKVTRKANKLIIQQERSKKK